MPSTNGHKLAWKDIGIIVGILSAVTGVFGWVHSQVTVPQMLNKAQRIIQESIDRHEKVPHPGAASREEINRHLDRIFKQLDSLEGLIRTQRGK